jgi:hypothetical protein
LRRGGGGSFSLKWRMTPKNTPPQPSILLRLLNFFSSNLSYFG